MAIYHLSSKVFTRNKGQTAIAAAAYRSGTKLKDYQTGITSDYKKKRGVVFSEVTLCQNAPPEYADREILWNAVQAGEKSKDAQLCRELEVALPKELTLQEQIELVQSFVRSLTDEGMCVDASIHDTNKGNPHAHILTTLRAIDPNGKWRVKQRKEYSLDKNGNRIPIIDPKTGRQKIGARGRKLWKREIVLDNPWNTKEQLVEWRKRWADICNLAIGEKNFEISENNLAVNYYAQDPEINYIDHRSYADQGIDKIPTVHEGWQARKMERFGAKSDRIEQNKHIQEMNSINSSVSNICNKYKKRNEINRKNYLKEVERHEDRIGSFGRNQERAGNSRSTHQYHVHKNASYSPSERDAFGELAAMQRRNNESEGANEGISKNNPSIEEVMSMSLAIDTCNDNIEHEAEDLLDAILQCIFGNKKKKKNHSLQLSR